MGIATSDDAAVYRLSDDTALVATVDVFTPIVDDPYAFGQIAAANSLSDIYAMGAKPLFALSVIGFPSRTLPLDTMSLILRGGVDKAAEAGIAIIGGHSVDDPEPKYGLSVVGIAKPDEVVRNSTAKDGDVLVLTKPLGTGLVSQGIKQGRVSQEDIDEATRWMATLNREASEAMLEVGVSAATDVTGFGLLGHLHELVHGSGVGAHVQASSLPLLRSARDLAEQGIVPGGSRRNLDHFGRFVRWDDRIEPAMRLVLADAQTSGGLLIAVAEARKDALVRSLGRRGVPAAVIGHVEAALAGTIVVDP